MEIAFPFSLRFNKILLLMGNVFGGIILIVLQNASVLPLSLAHFLFFSFVGFLCALYRPGWVFLLFIGMLPLEIIHLATPFAGLDVRPYQWLAVLLYLALTLRFLTGRLPFKLFRPIWCDGLLLLLLVGSFLALLNAPVFSVTLKQTLVVCSFVGLYFLGRIFFRTLTDVRQGLPFFLGSSVVVFGYALWQNIRSLRGEQSYTVMAGRPNSTFSEADWLGFFTLVVLALICALLLFLIKKTWTRASFLISARTVLTEWSFWGLFVLQSFTWLTLLVAVSRSAWLGAAVVCVLSFGLFIFYHGWVERRAFFPAGVFFASTTACTFFITFSIITIFHLTPFALFERAASTGGLQKITVSCRGSLDWVLPQKIRTVEELPASCRFIRLEEITAERALGNVVEEIYRADPNISVRQEIYIKTLTMIREHPVWGIGWGSAAVFLGTDERGAGLNASNIFLEVWLSSGLLGLLSFLWLLASIILAAFKGYIVPNEEGERIFALFLLLAFLGALVFNMFNTGLLLGFFFLLLALGVLNIERVGVSFKHSKTV